VIPPEVGDSVQPTNISPPFPETKTLEIILRDSKLTDKEVNELGWRVVKRLAEFVQMWEKYSMDVEIMDDREKNNMAKILDSKELRPLNRAIFSYQSLNGTYLVQNFPPGQVVTAPTMQEAHKNVQPANFSSPLPEPKSIETIICHSGLTDEEVDKLGWTVVKGLAGFIQLCERISAAIENMGDRAKENMAKILDSEKSHPLSIAIYNYQNSNGVGLAPNFGAIADIPNNNQLAVLGLSSAAYCEEMHTDRTHRSYPYF
jgi:uncharacterized protein (UPF0210 family)